MAHEAGEGRNRCSYLLHTKYKPCQNIEPTNSSPFVGQRNRWILNNFNTGTPSQRAEIFVPQNVNVWHDSLTQRTNRIREKVHNNDVCLTQYAVVRSSTRAHIHTHEPTCTSQRCGWSAAAGKVQHWPAHEMHSTVLAGARRKMVRAFAGISCACVSDYAHCWRLAVQVKMQPGRKTGITDTVRRLALLVLPDYLKIYNTYWVIYHTYSNFSGIGNAYLCCLNISLENIFVFL